MIRKSRIRHRRLRITSLEQLEHRRLLAVFNVDTLDDTVAVNLASGVDSQGKISLRSAIMAANAIGGANTIVMPAPLSPVDVHYLTIGGRNDDSAALGDLDLRGRLTIQGNGAQVDAQTIDRVFDVMNAAEITISNLSIDGGEAADGGGIYNRGRLTLDDVRIAGVARQNTTSQSKGGALFNGRTGVVQATASFLNGSAVGRDGENGIEGFFGQSGGSSAGGALYNLGQVTWNAGGINGQAVGGSGGRGADGRDGADAIGNVSGSDGTAGTSGGRGGSVNGGAIFNGSTAVLNMLAGGIQGDAQAGRGGDGGHGGKGGDAGYWFEENAGGIWAARSPAKGGNGGAAGSAMGGAIYNNGGTINISRGTLNSFTFIARAVAYSGGAGGSGGGGGDGVFDLLPDGGYADGTGGADGGNGANGGSALGGAIYSIGGTIQIDGAATYEFNGNGVQAGDQGVAGSAGGGGTTLGGFADSGFMGLYGISGLAEGGFLWVSGGSVNITNSSIVGIESRGALSGAARGGAFAISGGSVNVSQSSFNRNVVTGGYGAYRPTSGSALGGAIWMSRGSLNVFGSLFSESTATGGTGSERLIVNGGTGAGGALAMSGGTALIVDSTFESNLAMGGAATNPGVNNANLGTPGSNGGSALGGAIYATGGSITLSNSTINDNRVRATSGTGGFDPPGKGGSAFGGGVYATAAAVTINNSTIHGNSADSVDSGQFRGTARGGGIYHAGSGAMALNFVTVARNQAGSIAGTTNAYGAGIFNSSGPVSLRNSLVVLNVLGILTTSSQNDVSGPIISLGYNLVGVRNSNTSFTSTGDRAGTASRPLNARLGLLADNGGPTKTCELGVGSPAIDNADPTLTLTVDQRGISRLTNGRADIGAFEVQAAVLARAKRQ